MSRKYTLKEIADARIGNKIVVHIQTRSEYDKLMEVCPAKFNHWSPTYNWYLNLGGLSDTRKSYENFEYTVIEMEDIIFGDENEYILI